MTPSGSAISGFVLLSLAVTGCPGAGCAQGAGPQSPVPDPIATADWNINAPRSLALAPLPVAAVAAFVGRTLKEEDDPPAVCSFRFANLLAGEKLQLLASLDYSGRTFCNTVIVVRKGESEFPVSRLPAWEVNDVSQVITDLSYKESKVLAIPSAFSDYNGSECVAEWTRLYAWNGERLADVSREYPSFYKEQFERLRAAPDKTVCRTMETDKFSRFLGLDRTAGFGLARNWATSPERHLRRNAVAVFQDIGDEGSKQELSRLAQDQDPVVAHAAQLALKLASGDRSPLLYPR
jgi:hypothetical protein